MLVGYARTPGGISSVTEQWNGKRWKIVPNAADGIFAYSISCIGSSFCTVVGTNEIGGGNVRKTSVRSGTANSLTATPTPNLGSFGIEWRALRHGDQLRGGRIR